MVFPHLSLLVHFENSARENDLNSSLESIRYMFWSLKDEFQPVPTNSDSSTDLGHCIYTTHGPHQGVEANEKNKEPSPHLLNICAKMTTC